MDCGVKLVRKMQINKEMQCNVGVLTSSGLGLGGGASDDDAFLDGVAATVGRFPPSSTGRNRTASMPCTEILPSVC
jgi:hypothetical protein